MDARYPAVLEPEASGDFFVCFVDLEDTFTEGATLGCRLDHGVLPAALRDALWFS